MIVFSAIGLTVLFAAERAGSRGGKSEPKLRLSHEDLARKQQPKDTSVRDRTVRMDDLRKSSEGETGAPNAQEEERTKSLVGRSSIISAGSQWTIVPKGAILHVPPRFKPRVNGSRQGKLVGWQEFLSRNRGWIRLQEVSVPQARGEVPLSADMLKSFEGTGLVVVAVCRGGPISVMAPKEEEADPAEAAAREEKEKIQAKREAKAIDNLKQRLGKGRR